MVRRAEMTVVPPDHCLRVWPFRLEEQFQRLEHPQQLVGPGFALDLANLPDRQRQYLGLGTAPRCRFQPNEPPLRQLQIVMLDQPVAGGADKFIAGDPNTSLAAQKAAQRSLAMKRKIAQTQRALGGGVMFEQGTAAAI